MKTFLFFHLSFFLLTMTACESSRHEWIDERGRFRHDLIEEALNPLTRGCQDDSDCQVERVDTLDHDSCYNPSFGSFLAGKATEWAAFKDNLEQARNSIERELCAQDSPIWRESITEVVATCTYSRCEAKIKSPVIFSSLNYFRAAARLDQTIELSRSETSLNHYQYEVRNGDESVEGEVTGDEAQEVLQLLSEVTRCEYSNFEGLRGIYRFRSYTKPSNFLFNDINTGFCDSADLDGIEESVEVLKTLISSKIQDPSPAILESLQAFENWKIETLER